MSYKRHFILGYPTYTLNANVELTKTNTLILNCYIHYRKGKNVTLSLRSKEFVNWTSGSKRLSVLYQIHKIYKNSPIKNKLLLDTVKALLYL